MSGAKTWREPRPGYKRRTERLNIRAEPGDAAELKRLAEAASAILERGVELKEVFGALLGALRVAAARRDVALVALVVEALRERATREDVETAAASRKAS